MSTPFISICIPAYKNAAYLRRLLTSIIQQTFTSFEIIVTDDSPGDEVKNIVAEFVNLQIQYIKNQPAAGMPANWNKGLLLAKGEWIKMMHDDDWFDAPDALQKFADAARNTKASFVFSACKNIYAASGKVVEEKLIGKRKALLEGHPFNLFYLNVIGHPSTVMHRKDDSILYDTQFKWVVDIDFYIRYLHKHPGYVYLPQMLVNIGIDEQQVSSVLYKNPKIEIPEYLELLAKFPANLLMQHEFVFHLVWNLVRRFKIKKVEDIRLHGFAGTLPNNMEEIIRYQNTIPRLVVKQPRWSEKFMRICYRRLQGKKN